jgi:bifunctional oligoribonuclease and PAP phosphatase NrnA
MFKEFIENVKNYSKIGVFSHVRPDGDCIGSQVALCRWLKKNGLDAVAFNDDEISQDLYWLTGYFPIQKATEGQADECDLFIVVDGNAPHRFGSYTTWQEKNRRPVFMIDHHPHPEDDFDLAISVDDASSTCELIFNLYKEHDISQVDEEVAKGTLHRPDYRYGFPAVRQRETGNDGGRRGITEKREISGPMKSLKKSFRTRRKTSLSF